uniref:AIG1-type G domain-containing protein n=1 Tax=Neogobius melanostomus TaxID=47308 RepID=A0A8C6TET4_9GOBI
MITANYLPIVLLLAEVSPSWTGRVLSVFPEINISGCRRFRFGNDSPKTNRTIMVMGATGAGKSTLIDGMINSILGVQWKDDYRFKLVKEDQKETQAMSQTSEVTIDYSLTIIDTPGFGDTRGIDRDKEITEQIRNLFTSKTGVFELDAVCFVVQSALARLTPSQKYVFDSVLSIFGKDIAENIRVLAITASGVPCPEEKGVPLHFKFNNSVLFACSTSSTNEEDDEDEGFDEMFWAMGCKSMKKFFSALNQIQTKSLTLTKEVLSERKQLEILLESLQKQVRVGLSKMDEIKQTSVILQTHEAEISMNAKFEYEVTIPETNRIEKKENTFITNCQQCSFTCHDNCIFANDEEKIHCGAMRNGYCIVCPGKCIWSVHFNQKYKWEYKLVTKKQTLTDLKAKYEIATGAKNSVELIMMKLENEYEEVQVEVTVMMDESSSSLNRLKEIALKPDPLSTPDYIDMLIEGEKSDAKPGWKTRVESLNGMKEKAEYMAKVGRGEVLLEKGQRKTHKKPLSKTLWQKITAPFTNQ